jgi:lipopolysaccharide biosynthesis glycosyltransferase
VAIAPVMLDQLKSVFKRERNALQSTDFSFSRFLTPWMCDYQGWAIFMDCDQLVLDDIAKLWALRDERCAVQVVKHNHVPKEEVKFLGEKQSKYQKKNWSSVMLMNCAKCRALTQNT